MTVEERRERDRAARRQLIVTTARRIAEAEGWDAVTAVADTADTDTATEILWAALHGMATLGRSGRLRGGHVSERVNLLVSRFVAARLPE